LLYQLGWIPSSDPRSPLFTMIGVMMLGASGLLLYAPGHARMRFGIGRAAAAAAGGLAGLAFGRLLTVEVGPLPNVAGRPPIAFQEIELPGATVSLPTGTRLETTQRDDVGSVIIDDVGGESSRIGLSWEVADIPDRDYFLDIATASLSIFDNIDIRSETYHQLPVGSLDLLATTFEFELGKMDMWMSVFKCGPRAWILASVHSPRIVEELHKRVLGSVDCRPAEDQSPPEYTSIPVVLANAEEWEFLERDGSDIKLIGPSGVLSFSIDVGGVFADSDREAEFYIHVFSRAYDATLELTEPIRWPGPRESIDVTRATGTYDGEQVWTGTIALDCHDRDLAFWATHIAWSEEASRDGLDELAALRCASADEQPSTFDESESRKNKPPSRDHVL
jgi:hypothetical protein